MYVFTTQFLIRKSKRRTTLSMCCNVQSVYSFMLAKQNCNTFMSNQRIFVMLSLFQNEHAAPTPEWPVNYVISEVYNGFVGEYQGHSTSYHIESCRQAMPKIMMMSWYRNALRIPGARLTKAYDVTIQRYRNSHAKIENSKIHVLRCMGSKFCVKFQRCPLKFHTKFWSHTPQKMHFTRF